MTPPVSPSDNVILIGFRGSGKSTVGRALARRTGRPFVDSDDAVESAAGATIREIFQRESEAGFRQREAAALRELLRREGCVVSVGGGAVLDPANRVLLRDGGRRVWLTAPPDVLYRRIRADASSSTRRPALTPLDGLPEVQRLLAEREPCYRELAEWTIDTTSADIDAVVARLMDQLGLSAIA